MKKLFILPFIFLLILGCNERNDKKVEIIKLNDNDYMARSEIDNTKEVFSEIYKKELYEQIDQKIKGQGLSNDDFDNYRLNLFVNENGRLDKIIVLNAANEKITDIITGILSNQTFKIGTKSGRSVKYRFEWSYSSGFEYKVSVDQMPEPIGGVAAIQTNIIYPEIARRAGIQGRVYIQAFINENGDVVRTNILKGIGGGCDEAAVAALKKVKFKPGIQNGMPVKVQITVPVIFKLSDK